MARSGGSAASCWKIYLPRSVIGVDYEVLDATQIGPPASYADFSGDGKRLLFSDGKYTPDFEVFVSDIGGSNRSQITESNNGCFHGTFNSNGDKIYFLMEEWPDGATGHPKSTIWEVNADGTGQRHITNLYCSTIQWDGNRKIRHNQ